MPVYQIRKMLKNTRCYLLIWLALCGLSISNHTFAHFEHFLVRITHIAQSDQGIEIYVRIPLALVLLPESWQGVDTGQQFKYISTEKENGQWKYYVDKNFIEDNEEDLGKYIVSTFTLSQLDDQLLPPTFKSLKISPFHKRPSFNSLDKALKVFESDDATANSEARKIFGGVFDENQATPDVSQTAQSNNGTVSMQKSDRVEVFDAVVDLRLLLPDALLSNSLKIQSNAGSHFSITEQLVNITLFYIEGEKIQHTTNGMLYATYDGEVDTVEQVTNQIKSGIKHILIGLDHILFILILIIISTTWVDIIKTATVFTLGHSLTLMTGVLGYTPSGTWFVPFVETAIAATILYAAVSVIVGKKDSLSNYKIFVIGLLHGFGFSFILSKAMLNNGDIQFLNVLSFNLGIELGQIFIVAIVTPLIYWMDKYWLRHPKILRSVLSAPCLAIACYWVVERGVQTYQSVTLSLQ